MYRIFRSSWCPRRQLMAVERAERRARSRKRGLVGTAIEEISSPPPEAGDMSKVSSLTGRFGEGQEEEKGGEDQQMGAVCKLADVSHKIGDMVGEVVGRTNEVMVDGSYTAPQVRREDQVAITHETGGLVFGNDPRDCSWKRSKQQVAVSSVRQIVEAGLCNNSASGGAFIWRPKKDSRGGGPGDGRGPPRPRTASILDRMVLKVLSTPPPLNAHATKVGLWKNRGNIGVVWCTSPSGGRSQ